MPCTTILPLQVNGMTTLHLKKRTIRESTACFIAMPSHLNVHSYNRLAIRLALRWALVIICMHAIGPKLHATFFFLVLVLLLSYKPRAISSPFSLFHLGFRWHSECYSLLTKPYCTCSYCSSVGWLWLLGRGSDILDGWWRCMVTILRALQCSKRWLLS
jgi:hypothetical protein